MRRIGIDVRYLSHGLMGGVHTYVRHFVPAILDLAKECEIVLYADTKRPFELVDLPRWVTVRRLPWQSPLSTIQHDALMWRELKRDRLDLVHFPANYGFAPPNVATVLTVHDAINLLPLHEIIRGHPKRPGTLAKMIYLQALTKRSVKRADLLLTVSEHARNEIAQVGRIPHSRIVSIPHAPTPDLHRVVDVQVLDDIRRRHHIAHPFVLADALKNPGTLVRAWERLPTEIKRAHRMVFFARRPAVSPVVLEAQARGDAILLIAPSRADLIGLYSMASAFVFPSWIEGFGIPVLEAMTCGAPVIASDRGALPEVTGGAALLADAEDDEAFARYLESILSDTEAGERLRCRGYARAAQFSWSSTAQAMLDGYATAYQSRQARSGSLPAAAYQSGPMAQA